MSITIIKRTAHSHSIYKVINTSFAIANQFRALYTMLNTVSFTYVKLRNAMIFTMRPYLFVLYIEPGAFQYSGPALYIQIIAHEAMFVFRAGRRSLICRDSAIFLSRSLVHTCNILTVMDLGLGREFGWSIEK